MGFTGGKSQLLSNSLFLHEKLDGESPKPQGRITDKENISSGTVISSRLRDFGRLLMRALHQTALIKEVKRMALELTHKEMELMFSMLHNVDQFLEQQQREEAESQSDTRQSRLQKLVASNLRVKLNSELKFH